MSTPLEPVDNAPEQKVDPIDNFTDNLQLFWAKYEKHIYACIIGVLLIVAAKGAWDWNQLRIEKGIAADYAAAGASLDKLRAFADKNPSHVLAGTAHLRIADESYTLAKYADASASYGKAATLLSDSPFQGRALLGKAMADLFAGKAADGEAGLRALAEDTAAFKGLRAEAAYHLAVLCSESARPDDARKYADKVVEIDATGRWSQRAMALRASLPEPAAPATPAAPAAPEAGLKLSLPAAGGK